MFPSSINIESENKELVEDDTIANFERQLEWEQWTGNCTEPKDCNQFLLPDQSSNTQGVLIGLKSKPLHWRATNDKRASSGLAVAAEHRDKARGAGVQRREGAARGDYQRLSCGDILKSIPLFHTLSFQELSDLENECRTEMVPDGTKIVEEGHMARSVFVIREGTVRAYHLASATKRVQILTRGDYFGYSSVAQVMSFSSYVAAGHVLLICIPPLVFQSVVTSDGSSKAVMGLEKYNNDDINTTISQDDDHALQRHVEVFYDYLLLFKNTLQNSSRKSSPPFRKIRKQCSFAPSSRNPLVEQGRNRSTIFSLQYSSRSLGGSITGGGGSGDDFISNEKFLERELDVAKKALMLDILTAYSPELSFTETVERILRLCVTFFNVERTYFFLIQKDENKMIRKTSFDSSKIINVLSGIVALVARTKSALNVSDYVLDLVMKGSIDDERPEYSGYYKMLAVPCVDGEDVIGVFVLLDPVHFAMVTPFTDDEDKLATIASEQLAMLRIPSTPQIPSHSVTDIFSIRIRNIYCTMKISKIALLRCEVCLLYGDEQIGKKYCTKWTIGRLATDRPENTSKLTYDYLERIEFEHVRVCDIPQELQMLVSIVSSNYEVLAFAKVKVYDYQQQMKSGDLLVRTAITSIGMKKLDIKINKLLGKNVSIMLNLSIPSFGIEKVVVYEVEHLKNSKINDPTCISANHTNNSISLSHPIINAENINNIDQILCYLPLSIQKRIQYLHNDPLICLNKNDKKLVWDLRYTIYINHPSYLPLLVKSVNWFSAIDVAEFREILSNMIIPEEFYSTGKDLALALQLLDRKYADPKIRYFAVQLLWSQSDETLVKLMLQLTQVLRTESHLDCALSRFLLRRALQSPDIVGHAFFWNLRADVLKLRSSGMLQQEISDVEDSRSVCIRFETYINLFMRYCGPYRTALGHQLFVIKRLDDVVNEVKKAGTKAERLSVLHNRLEQTDFPGSFQLPIDPMMRVCGVNVSNCRVMDSKKKPLWLEFKNAESNSPPIICIFKSGDDLRQDQLVLQVLSEMESLWLNEGLDLRMSLYGCISTGNQTGFIEIVPGVTLAGVVADTRRRGQTKHTLDENSSSSWNWPWSKNDPSQKTKRQQGLLNRLRIAADALSSHNVLLDWLLVNNVDVLGCAKKSKDSNGDGLPNRRQIRRNAISGPSSSLAGLNDPNIFIPSRHSGLIQAVENFKRSCAGYCVATFVLGVGDRHNDNLMIKRTGELFHIDFGHILGNFKKKFGAKRERAPFVFTPAFAYVLGGEGSSSYNEFLELMTRAFLVLRRNAHMLISLLVLMAGCGLDELRTANDVEYVRDRLMLKLSEPEAGLEIKKILRICLHTFTTRVNDAVHLLVHAR